jgi:amicyanin
MKQKIAIIAAAAAALLLAVNLPADTPTVANLVKIDNFSFTPQTLTVPAGTTVTWVNKDDVPHTVISTDKKFKSRALDTDDRFSYTFSAPGTYDYFCSVHPHMTGKIVVQ